MDQSEKDALLAKAKAHVEEVTQKVQSETPELITVVERAEQELRAARRLEDREMKSYLFKMYEQKLAGFRGAAESPYFARCDIAQGPVYFGKYAIPELEIYSWVSPAAQIRFNEPGTFSYTSGTGKTVRGELSRNDQYLIAHGKITFMATTTKNHPRTLIYQDYFSTRKSTFALPEIVERMERAQDTVIRAHHEGSFLISGPAGSGKTTLALHRIAYLLQAPEVADKFTADKVLVLVQDDSTKQYFDELLPSLGIKDVAITTFSAWARDQVNLSDHGFVNRYGTTEIERDLYELAKYTALRASKESANTTIGKPTAKKPFSWLEKVYTNHLTPELKKVFTKQKKEKVLDRFDLTLLLQAELNEKGMLSKEEKIYDDYVVGRARFKWTMVPVQYSLILLDEVQNYLAEQIQIIKSCISPKTKAMTYVGDLAQQTSLFTMRDWNAIHETFADGRSVKLDKVYRSTRQILEYIKSVGYAIEVPTGLREGKSVENITKDHIDEIIASNPDVLIGILAVAPEDSEEFQGFETDKVRVMTVAKAQGVEFDIVIFVEGKQNLENYPDKMAEEKQKTLKDQVYVGLTRAMNELYIFTP